MAPNDATIDRTILSKVTRALPDQVSSQHRLFLYVDAGILLGGSTSLKDVENNPIFEQVSKYELSPVPMLRLIKTIHEIANDIKLGFGQTEEGNKRVKLFRGRKDDDGGGAEEEKVTENAKAPCHVDTTQKIGNDLHLTVKCYVAPFVRNSRCLGYILCYTALDVHYSFDLAINTYLEAEDYKEKHRKKRASDIVDPLAPFNTKKSWVDSGLNVYLNEGMATDNTARLSAMTGLTSWTKEVFNMENVIWWIQRLHGVTIPSMLRGAGSENLREEDLSMEDSHVPETTVTPDGPCSIEFPNEAYEVPSQYMPTDLFLNIPLHYFTRKTLPKFANPKDKTRYLRDERNRINNSSDALSPDASLRAHVKEMKASMSREDFWNYLHGEDFDRFLRSALAGDAECGANSHVYEYMKKMEAETEGVFSLIDPITTFVDDRFSFLGNCIARDYQICEGALGILHLHQEFCMISKTFLSSYDMSNKYKMRVHPIISGTKGSGKSTIMGLMKEMCIPGKMRSISHFTAHALTTDINYSGCIIAFDELPAVFSDKEGADQQQRLKEALSDGIIRTEACVPNQDTKKRDLIITITKIRCNFYANTNDGFADFDDAMGSRFGKINSHDRGEREGRQGVTEDIHKGQDKRIQGLKKRFIQEYRTRDIFSACLFLMMRVEAIPEIDARIPAGLIAPVVTILREAGYRPEQRDFSRLLSHTEAVCVYEGTSRVALSDEIYKKGDPFSIGQVVECARFMQCTREHFWTALGETFSMLVNPDIECVLSALVELVVTCPEGPLYSRITARNNETDQNYYLLDVSTMPSQSKNPTVITRDLICGVLGRKGDIMSEKNVMDVLIFLASRWFTCKKDYNAPDGKRKSDTSMKILRNKSGSGWGIEILREFLDSKFLQPSWTLDPEQTSKGMLKKCIQATRGDKQGFVVFGTSRRDEGKPHELDILYLDGKGDTKKELRDLKKNNNSDVFFYFGEEVDVPEKEEVLDKGLDQYFKDDYAANLGAPPLKPKPKDECIPLVYKHVHKKVEGAETTTRAGPKVTEIREEPQEEVIETFKSKKKKTVKYSQSSG